MLEIEQGFINTYREKYGDAVLNNRDAYIPEEEREEKARGYSANWVKNNPERKKELDAKYSANNPEKIKERNAKYRANNPEKIKEYSAEYRANNRETIRAYMNEQFKCPCGGRYTRARKARHFDTKLHQKFIQIQNQNQIQKQMF